MPLNKKKKGVKLAAVAMNQHYHPYSDLSPPHPPSPDNNYPPLHHHNGHSGQLSQMDAHQGFHHSNNNNNGAVKPCAGCGGNIYLFE